MWVLGTRLAENAVAFPTFFRALFSSARRHNRTPGRGYFEKFKAIVDCQLSILCLVYKTMFFFQPFSTWLLTYAYYGRALCTTCDVINLNVTRFYWWTDVEPFHSFRRNNCFRITLLNGVRMARGKCEEGKLYVKLDSYLDNFSRAVNFPDNSPYTQAVTYATNSESIYPQISTTFWCSKLNQCYQFRCKNCGEMANYTHNWSRSHFQALPVIYTNC